MSRITSSEVRSLMEAYSAVYAPQELTEEQVWEEVETWVNSLLEEGYDLSDYTWEEMYESYIEEQGGGGSTAPRNQNVNPNASSAIRNVVKSTIGSTPLGLAVRGVGAVASQPPAPPGTGARRGAAPRPQAPSIRDGKYATPSQQVKFSTSTPSPARTPAPAARTPGVTPAPAPRNSGTRPPAAPAAPAAKPATPAAKPAAPKPAPAGLTGNKALAVAAAEKARIRGTSETDNPLMKNMRSRMAAPTSAQSPDVAKLGKGNQSLVNNPNVAKPSGGALSQATAAASKPAAFSPAPEVKATNTIAAAPKPTPVSPRQQRLKMEMEYDAYDLVLEYLLSQGHADTLEEANYVMLEMDAEMIGDIVEVMTPPPIMPPPPVNAPPTPPKVKKDITFGPGETSKGPVGKGGPPMGGDYN